MSHQFEIIRKPRTTILAAIEALSLDQLNQVPAGFNNNIIWNLGHMVAAQCGIWYKRAGLPLPIEESFFETYKPGTKPERAYTADDLAQIKELMFSTLDKMEADLQTNMFANYPTWTTRYGADIANINEAVAFLPFHEGLHIGAIVALGKLVE
ncbi:MAG: DinB family protein [Bacteroidota bacterium]